MTPDQFFMDNTRIGIGAVILAACLTLLTLGSVSFWGNTDFFLSPTIVIIFCITVSLIVILMHITP